MKIADSKGPVTAANRGYGDALVEEAFSPPLINGCDRLPDGNLSCTCKNILSKEELNYDHAI